MNESKTKTVFEERDELRRENERLEKVLWTSNEALVMANESLAESRKLAAQLTGDIEELTFCEECTNDCVKMPENNYYPPRYCHTCQQILVAQICEANARLAATEEALAQVQRESAELRAKYETHCGYWDGPLMKIARAAVASRIAGNAHCYINGIEPRDYDALAELAVAQDEAESAFNDALIEYRSLTEYGALHSYALSPPKQAAVDRGIAGAEKVEEMWERN